MAAIPATLFTKDGTPYEIHPCVVSGTRFTSEFLQEQIARAFNDLSEESRWQRFAGAVRVLPKSHLDHLTDLDGHCRVAWCACIIRGGTYKGIGIARYIRLPDEAGVAEFAVTVVDAFQGQGIGRHLMDRLIESARDNAIDTLRGYVLPGNERMLTLCRRYRAAFAQGRDFVEVGIDLR